MQVDAVNVECLHEACFRELRLNVGVREAVTDKRKTGRVIAVLIIVLS